MIKEITQNKDEVLRQRIYPNIIFNRFDLWFGPNNYELYNLGKDYIVPVKARSAPNNKIYLEVGLYLTALPSALLKVFFSFLFTRYPNANYIRVMHSYTKIANAEPYPYWHINLPATKEDFDKILGGVMLTDGEIAADELEYIDDSDHKKIGIEIHSGKNRIVRRIFESLGYEVKALDRVYFAGLTKKGLKKGQWRYLSEGEVNILKMGSYQ